MKKKNGLKQIKMVKKSDMTYEEIEEKYLKKCKVNNLSDYTIRAYIVQSGYFKKFLNNPKFKAEDINRDLIDDYILYLKETGIKGITINTYVHHISPIIKYGIELGIIEKFGFKDIRTNETIKQVYTDEELRILLDKPDMTSFAEYRNWVIINFLLGTGIRALELRTILIKDVDLNSSMLILRRTKNRKQRYIPISKSLNMILEEYISYRNAESEEDYLFCNIFGEQLPRTTLQMGITKYCKKRGVNKYSLHLFRHTFAKKWIINGGSAFALQKILGHSSLKMVNHYVNLYAEDLQNNYDNFCALENLAKKNKDRITLE